jgi:hypothetical protein
MQDVLTLTALAGAAGSIIAIVTFWFSRGRAEAESYAKAESASAIATSALAKTDLLAAALGEARLEFARDYASHKDLAAAEFRYAGALDSLRSEIRGMNERLDRIIEKLIGTPKPALS